MTGTVSGLPAYINDNGIGNNPADASFSAANSQKLYKLNSSTNKTGLGITLKVMAGDKIDIFGKSYYFQNNAGGAGANSAIPVLELLSGLLGSPGGAAAGGHTTASELNGIPGVISPLSATYLNDPTRNDAGNPTRPRAFINYVFLDEQFKFAAGGFSAVNNTPALKDHYSELQNRVAQKNGYLYIYVSNESPVNVFFDNLQIVHTKGAILEETHYYPFGLTMSGISSKGLNGVVENKFKFNDGSELASNEIGENIGFELYETPFRRYDQKIGRFWQQDPLCETTDDFTVYAFCNNNPILFNDPLGLDTSINGIQLTDKEAKSNVLLSSKSPSSIPNQSFIMPPPSAPIWVPNVPTTPTIPTPVTPTTPVPVVAPVSNGLLLKSLGLVGALLSPSPHAYSFPGNDETYWINHPEDTPALLKNQIYRIRVTVIETTTQIRILFIHLRLFHQ